MGNNGKSRVMKLAFLGGLALAFLSLFLEWYHYEVKSTGDLIAQWSFQLLIGWQTSFRAGINSNEDLMPASSMEAFIMSILLMAIIVMCIFGVLLKDVETTNSVEKSKPYLYLNVFLAILLGYFISVLPCTFLFPRNLYVPFMLAEDLQEGTTSFYCLGPAYLMQATAFFMVFPKVIMSVITINTFRAEQEEPDRIIDQKLATAREEITLDKFIAELSSKVGNQKSKDSDIIFEQFQQQRQRRKYR